MSFFLERQQIKKRRKILKRFMKKAEKFLFSTLIVTFVVAVLFMFYFAVVKSSYFAVQDVKTNGPLHKLNGELLISLSGVKKGDPLFLLDMEEIRDRLFENKWVRVATVRRHLPSAVWIYVEEFKPSGILAGDDLRYVDSKGYAFKELEAQDDRDFVILSGVETENEIKKSLEVMDLFASSETGKKFGLSEVTFDKRRGYSVVTNKDGVIISLGDKLLAEKLNKLDGRLPILAGVERRLKYVVLMGLNKVVVGYRRT